MLSIGGAGAGFEAAKLVAAKKSGGFLFKIDLYYSYTYVETDPSTRMKLHKAGT